MVIDGRLPVPARKLQNLVCQLLDVGKHQAERVVHAGGVRVNGRVVTRPQTTLEIGDRLDVQYDTSEFHPAPRVSDGFEGLEILYQDEHLVVVNKPPALLTVPTPYRERNTLISLLEKRLQREGTGERAFCVHRLDRGVSGVLVFGKRLDIAEALRNQFEARKPKRRYVAIVAGVLREARGTFRTYLATDKSLHRYSTTDAEHGELAITHYQVLQVRGDTTMVEVWLETGRRNQIRVHFAEAGHPVLGDPRYGKHAMPPGRWPHRRLALHAANLGFTHPIHGEPLEFHSPLPEEMAAFQRPARPRDAAGKTDWRGRKDSR